MAQVMRSALEAWHIFRHHRAGNPLHIEEFSGRHLRRRHLLLIFVFDFRMKVARLCFDDVFAATEQPPVSRSTRRSPPGCPVAELERTLAETASGDDADGVSGTTINLDVGDEALTVLAFWIVEAKPFESVQSHAYAENLSGAEMAVGDLCLVKEFVQGIDSVQFNRDWSSRSVVQSVSHKPRTVMTDRLKD